MKTWVGKWINVVELNGLWIGTSQCCEKKKQSNYVFTNAFKIAWYDL